MSLEFLHHVFRSVNQFSNENFSSVSLFWVSLLSFSTSAVRPFKLSWKTRSFGQEDWNLYPKLAKITSMRGLQKSHPFPKPVTLVYPWQWSGRYCTWWPGTDFSVLPVSMTTPVSSSVRGAFKFLLGNCSWYPRVSSQFHPQQTFISPLRKWGGLSWFSMAF